MSAPVMSKAGRYGRQLRDRAARRLDDHERVVRVERLQLLVRAHEAVRPDPVRRRGTGCAARRSPLYASERRVVPERGRRASSAAARSRERRPAARGGRFGSVAEPEPAAEPVRRGGGVELLSRAAICASANSALQRLDPGADEGDAVRGDLLEPVACRRRLRPERRRVREPDREEPSFRPRRATRSRLSMATKLIRSSETTPNDGGTTLGGDELLMAARTVRPGAPGARLLQRPAHRGLVEGVPLRDRHLGPERDAGPRGPGGDRPPRGRALAVGRDGDVDFGYWHVVPAVRHTPAGRAGTSSLGHVEAPWLHVHFAERRAGVYRDPLRAGRADAVARHDRAAGDADRLSRERPGALARRGLRARWT